MARAFHTAFVGTFPPHPLRPGGGGETSVRGTWAFSATGRGCDHSGGVRHDRASADVIETGAPGPTPSAAYHPRRGRRPHQPQAVFWGVPVEPDASRGARPVRRGLVRSKAARTMRAETTRTFYPMEFPRTGATGTRLGSEAVPAQSGCESRPRGEGCDARTTRLAWGLLRSARDQTGPTDRPGDRPTKRRPGRAQPREARTPKRLPVRPTRRRCRTAKSPHRRVPESFCVLLGENPPSRGGATMPG